jgi:hypothetical protein
MDVAAMAIQIGMAVEVDQSVTGEDLDHGLTLIVVVFQEQPTSRGQGNWGIPREASDGGQPIDPSIQGQTWLMITNDRIEPIHLTRGDVWGVGQHQIQASPQASDRSKPIPLDEANATLQAGFTQIAVGLRQGGWAHIHGQALAAREGTGQAHGQAATACAQICPQHPRRWHGFRSIEHKKLGEINQGLGLRPRDEHPWPYFKHEVPPITPAQEVLQGNRFAQVMSPEALNLQAWALQRNGGRWMEPQGVEVCRRDSARDIQQPIEGPWLSSQMLELPTPGQNVGNRKALGGGSAAILRRRGAINRQHGLG